MAQGTKRDRNQEGQVHLVRGLRGTSMPNVPVPLGLSLLGLNAVPLLLHLQCQG